VIEGRLPQTPDELALGSRGARDLDVDVGAVLRLRGPEGEQELRVSGIAILPGVEEAGLLGRIGLLTVDGMARLAPDEEMSSALIELAQGADRDDIEAVVAPFGMSAGRFDTPAEIVNLRRVDSTPYLVAGIVGLLAVLSIGHLVVTSARRHRFDLAVLRAFGATRAWLGGVVHWQATAIAALAVLLAVPLGVGVGTALYGPYAERIGARPDAAIPAGWLVLLAVGLLVVTNLAVVRLARTVSRRSTARLLDREAGEGAS
jgi:predicted lysophospholipase L1 biosynthesis ABC-type transport system permease subunit